MGVSAHCASYAVKPPTDKTKIATSGGNGIGDMRMHAPPEPRQYSSTASTAVQQVQQYSQYSIQQPPTYACAAVLTVLLY